MPCVIPLTHAAYVEHFTQVHVLKDVPCLVSQLTYTLVKRCIQPSMYPIYACNGSWIYTNTKVGALPLYIYELVFTRNLTISTHGTCYYFCTSQVFISTPGKRLHITHQLFSCVLITRASKNNHTIGNKSEHLFQSQSNDQSFLKSHSLIQIQFQTSSGTKITKHSLCIIASHYPYQHTL